MKFIGKTLMYLFIASTILIFGYTAVKYSRDTVRIWNAKTLAKTIDLYVTKNGKLPEPQNGQNISEYLVNAGMLTQEIRDPVFTSSTVILDEYVHTLLKIYRNIGSGVNTFFTATDSISEFVSEAQEESNDEEIKNQLENAGIDLNALLSDSSEDADIDISDFNKENLDANMLKLEELADSGIAPDFVIAYTADDDKYEISVKLESPFSKSKMQDDNGNDDERYEIGTNIMLDTSLRIQGEEVFANDERTSIIK